MKPIWIQRVCFKLDIDSCKKKNTSLNAISCFNSTVYDVSYQISQDLWRDVHIQPSLRCAHAFTGPRGPEQLVRIIAVAGWVR